ncbi:dephospho-CoA kinase [Pilimelia terevasa]|uniref:Dephospho-CoA kinase n=1 Tax=Pilimelia terevasa TaxID=53372 RepID=A0A8J3FGW3_9ACTN|nr:dephospho-CoA kinase [Pilimelia terevasa]GGK23749.1 dephospho-CoA kinase [Pilimelia terevasa]
MLQIALTGGIGAGKSAVAARLVTRGAVLVDADVLAREAVARGTDGLAEVVAAFGPSVRAADGDLDRAALAGLVFTDAQARRRLEGIVHPRVRARAAALVAAAPPDAVVVHDIPLLAESGQAAAYPLVVVVDAARRVRLDRLVATRGMSEQDAAARIDAQATRAQRLAVADVVLPNESTPAALHAAVDRLWDRRLLPFAAHLRTGTPPPRAAPTVVPPDPGWAAQGDRLCARLRHALGTAAGRVAHVGPTAVPGLPAPDVLDVQVVVDSSAAARTAAAGCGPAGLVVPPRRTEAARGEAWAVEADALRPVTVRFTPAASPAWRQRLLLRDWLRADPAARSAWTDLQGARPPGGGASPDEALGRAAGEWAARTGWTPT